MSEIEVIQEALRTAANRRRWQAAMNGAARGILAGAILWLTALAVFKLFPIPYTVVVGAAAVGGLLTLVLFLRGWLRKASLAQTARWVDGKEHLQERLSSALEIATAGGDASWRALLLADAARFAKEIDPRRLLPLGLPQAARWAVLTLALCAGLGFLPEYRSKVFLEKQKDAQIVKEAGKQAVALVRRSMEQRPPRLEQTKQALQEAEDVGMKLDQASLTRSEALKDLANVAEKLKQQLKDMGEKNPALKAIEKAAHEGNSVATVNDAMQKQMDALQKALGKAAENQAALNKLGEALEKAQQSAAAMPKGDSPEAKAAREKMAQTLSDIAKQAEQLGQPMPNLKQALAALKSNQSDVFQKDMGQATKDVEKMQEMAKELQQMQEQSEKAGKDLPEQLKFGQADAAQQSLQKMMADLRSGKMSEADVAKMMDEVSRSVSPASPYADAAKFLKQAGEQMKSGDKGEAAKSLAQAKDELGKISAQMNDAKDLAASADALDKAEREIATRCNFGKGDGNGDESRRWSESSELFPQESELWKKRGYSSTGTGPRELTDRGDPQLSDGLAPTRLHGQIGQGGPMPSISLKGVNIKGQSGVQYQEAATAAQTDAQNALNQDQVPRAYQGAVRDYFDDMKKEPKP